MTVTGRAEGPAHERDKPATRGRGTLSGPLLASDVLAAARALRAATLEIETEGLANLVKAGGQLERHLWAKTELTILGCGQALRLPLPAGWAAPEHTSLVSEALSAIHTEHEPAGPGCGPLAMGALPYDPSLSGHLVVPRVTFALRCGRAWATVVLPAEGASSSTYERAVAEQLAEITAPPTPTAVVPLPDRFELGATMPHEDWKDLVARAVKVMEGGSLSKVVLARQVEVVANRPFVLPETLGRLAHLYPSCAVFQVEGFIGASPETLLRRTGAQIESHPLAGTVARSGDPATDDALVAALMSSAKDRHEHQLVVDEIAAKLRPFATVEVPAAPSIVPLRNVSHLGTSIKGTLHGGITGWALDGAGAPQNGHGNGAGADTGVQQGQAPRVNRALPSSLELAAVLQPTPAVGGLPVDVAIQWQRDNEGFDRDRYAGPVGWVDRNGDGEWALGLRSAKVWGNRAIMYAGNGIVAGSDPEVELGETQLKLQALLAALVRP
jgi:menaquinone-specific isochorismate synthase